MAKEKRDPIAELEEWQEHQYNPGYWVNRLPPGFPLKRERRLSLGYLFLFVFYLVFVIFVLIVILSGETFYFPLLFLFGVPAIYSLWRFFRHKPDPRQRTQEEMDEIRRKENQERKRDLPKRNKNYK